MKELVEAGLIGAGRVNVRTPEMVRRYNEALERIGQTPTELESFTIDGVGWSPEIADEKKNPLYLFQGEANRCAIILSPDQQGKPIYFPYASYERSLMRAYFSKYRREITDITATHPIILIFDNEITRYETPLDLVLDYVTVKADTEGLVEAAESQKRLLAELAEDDRWIDPGLRAELAENAKKNGDLRYRNVRLADFVFKDCQSFFTEAFGGVFLIRSKQDLLVVLENPDRAGLPLGTPRDGIRVVTLADPALPKLLIERGLTTVDLGWYADHPNVLDDIRNCLVALLVTSAEPDLGSYLGLSEVQRKAILAKLPADRLVLLSALERLQRRLRREAPGPQAAKGVEEELALLLTTSTAPRVKNPRRDPRYETTSMLLARLRSYDPLELYRADKNRFVEKFNQWPVAYQEWAKVRIKERYEPVMNQKEE